MSGVDASGASKPLVSIGVPVYNESKYIRSALEALLRQSYSHIEVIVFDNASTDETWSICQDMASADTRLRIYKNEKNVGAAENTRLVFREAKGEYFMWAAGHDSWEKNYLEVAVNALEARDSAVLCFGVNHWIDDDGEKLVRTSGWADTVGLGPCSRMVFALLGSMNPILGVIRRQAIEDIPKLLGCIGWDLLVLAELSLRGEFINVTGAAWSRREFRHEPSYAEKLKRYKSKEFNLVDTWFYRHFPNANILIQLVFVIARAKIPWLKKAVLLFSTPLILLIKYIDFKLSASAR
ncbi:glycosyltransferase family 2 protein [Exilibacterium tricleocarpae]|uniref:Glycosyltransferase family 2 protein n=1 Tax=Exilibacterium tricleocarpae TaxID=2591008 RepID=A0A545TQF6_9GAMM|nr:glycosyltransferase family 2 protein [Exilibacterium tricleocarpae]TQV79463.1 glycosyltransferase family 2 protein [Exilibacterium tricleocarpae]